MFQSVRFHSPEHGFALGVLRLVLTVLLCAVSGLDVCGQDLTECDKPDETIEFAVPVAAELEIDDDVEIDVLQISVSISHESISDLELEVTSPAGTTILLFDSSGSDESGLGSDES